MKKIFIFIFGILLTLSAFPLKTGNRYRLNLGIAWERQVSFPYVAYIDEIDGDEGFVLFTEYDHDYPLFYCLPIKEFNELYSPLYPDLE